MAKLTKNKKNLILEDVIVSYSPKDDSIHITSKDPDLGGVPFNITLNQSTKTETAIRNLLVSCGAIKEELIGKTLPDFIEYPTIENENPETFELGVSRYGVVSWEPAKHSHLIAYGNTGTGKTQLFRSVLKQAFKHPDDWEVYIFNHLRYADRNHEYRNMGTVFEDGHLVTNIQDAVTALEKIHKEVVERHTKVKEGNATIKSFRKVLIAFDSILEFAVFKPYTIEDSQAQEKFRVLVSDLIELADSVGCYFLIGSQRYDHRFPSNFSFKSSIFMGRASGREKDVIASMGTNLPLRTPRVIGRGIARLGNDEPIQFQAYFSGY